ncbi:hypothetical protein VIA_001494 [Vibrio orientalis CIP 102891 = ATCC 33934]|uniref:Uncharacterized protein n=2 Tax=Vibrio orientalis CIP 102891 = ATCC 33934 TaxID=675816 RepID=A0ABM9Z3S9_VIBOR|nr:hypothetical protein VIA_001494 [Vibrio orientalis CIP 102891 = ATCC 33934]
MERDRPMREFGVSDALNELEPVILILLPVGVFWLAVMTS